MMLDADVVAVSPSSVYRVLGIIGTKDDSKNVMQRVSRFVEEQLHLQVSEARTLQTAKAGGRSLRPSINTCCFRWLTGGVEGT